MTYTGNYDPSIFYTSIHKKPSTPGRPVHGLVNYTIKLTVTLKDIGLEGMDSSNPEKASKILRRELKKKQEKSQKSQEKNSFIPKLPVEPPSLSPRIKRLIDDAEIAEPIYEGTFYKNKINKSQNICSNNDPKPIGLLSQSQKRQKPQTVIPRANAKKGLGSRLSSRERSVPVSESNIQ